MSEPDTPSSSKGSPFSVKSLTRISLRATDVSKVWIPKAVSWFISMPSKSASSWTLPKKTRSLGDT